MRLGWHPSRSTPAAIVAMRRAPRVPKVEILLFDSVPKASIAPIGPNPSADLEWQCLAYCPEPKLPRELRQLGLKMNFLFPKYLNSRELFIGNSGVARGERRASAD